jgi:hypothetical protein
VLRRILGPKRDEITAEWSKLHNVELNCLYSSPNIVLVIKSRRMRWAGYAARMERADMYTGFGGENLRKGNHLEDPGIDGRVILKCTFRKWDVGAWTGPICFRIGTGGGHF